MNGSKGWAAAVASLLAIGVADAAPWEVTFDSAPSAATVSGEVSSSSAPRWVAIPGGGAYLLTFERRSYDLAGEATGAVVVRVAASGETEWTRRYGGLSLAPSSAFVLQDGSLVIAHDDGLARIRADGTLAWRSSTDVTGPAVATADGRVFAVAITGYGEAQRLVEIDAATGALRQSLRYEPLGTCGRIRHLAVGGAGELYATTVCEDSGARTHVARLSTQPLRTGWQREWSGTPAAAPLARGTALYVALFASPAALVRVDAASGAEVWRSERSGSIPEVEGRLLSGDDDRVVWLQTGRTEAIASATGVLQWAVDEPGRNLDAQIVGSSVYVVGVRDVRARLARIELDSGAVASQSDIGGAGSGASFAASVVTQANRVWIAGTQCASAGASFCAPVTWDAGLDTPPAAPSEVAFVQPNFGNAVPAPSGRVLATALEWTAGGQQLRVRMLRDADGVTLWESVVPSVLVAPMTSNRVVPLAMANGDVAVMTGSAAGYYPAISFNRGHWTVHKFDGQTGDLRWSRLIPTDEGGVTTSIYEPSLTSDAAGNVFVGDPQQMLDGFWMDSPLRRSVRKFDGATGAQLWRVSLNAQLQLRSAAPTLLAMGGNLLLGELPTATVGGQSLLSGSDGGALWTHELAGAGFGNTALVPASNGGVFVVASSSLTAPLDVVRLAADGGAEWSTTLPQPGNVSAVGAIADPASGDLYINAYRRVGGVSQSGIYRLDGATGTLRWQQVEAAPTESGYGQIVFAGIRDGALHYLRFEAGGDRWLARRRLSDGAALDTQWFASTRMPQSLVPTAASRRFVGFAIDGGPLHVGADDASVAGQAARLTVGKLPPYEPSASGDIATDLQLGSTGLAPGTPLPFTLRISVTGAAPSGPASASLSIPLDAAVTTLTCTIGGTPCSATVTPSGLAAMIALGAGQSAEIGGTVTSYLTLSDAGAFSAAATTEYGYREADIGNNYVNRSIVQSLFASGFD